MQAAKNISYLIVFDDFTDIRNAEIIMYPGVASAKSKTFTGVEIIDCEGWRNPFASDIDDHATTVLGLLPMALGLGEGAEIRTPMAITVIAGLISSTFLTLLVIPTVYSVLAPEKAGDGGR